MWGTHKVSLFLSGLWLAVGSAEQTNCSHLGNVFPWDRSHRKRQSGCKGGCTVIECNAMQYNACGWGIFPDGKEIHESAQRKDSIYPVNLLSSQIPIRDPVDEWMRQPLPLFMEIIQWLQRSPANQSHAVAGKGALNPLQQESMDGTGGGTDGQRCSQ